MNKIPAELAAPPEAKAALRALRSRGHMVAVRYNRNGAIRYSIDGRRDCDGATLVKKSQVTESGK